MSRSMNKSTQLMRSASGVVAIDKKTGEVFAGLHVWTPEAPIIKRNADLCFAKCLVLPGSTRTVLKCRLVDPPDSSKEVFEVLAANARYVNNIDPMDYPDIGMLPHSSEPAVLDFLKQRYVKGQIYTEARPLLVAINPFKDLGNTTDKVIEKYRSAPDVEKLPPHVFGVARVALENLHSVRKSQTIIVSGESGAGKTEATKQVMRFFAARTATRDAHIQEAVLAANPVLEAFGNAKTIRNNNSSRFGRFMQLQLAKSGGIDFGCVKNFLLEKSRILTQQDDERSYHVFYQLVKCATPEQRKRYHLRSIREYNFINPNCLDAPGVNDAEEFREIQQSFNSMGFSSSDIDSVFSIVSGVLLLGNCRIGSKSKFGVPDAAHIDDSNRAILREACQLLFLEPKLVEEALLIKISKAGVEQVRGVWKQEDAVVLKDSLAKAMYDKLFDWIVQKLNVTIEPPNGKFDVFMAMLDIFGFEVFQTNSLEQFFINITNEMLQKNFTDAVFDRENKLYREEGISAKDLVWTTNAPLIKVITAKTGSIMAALEDQCLAPGGTDEKFLASAHATVKDATKLIRPKVSSNVNFIIAHSIGHIQYNVSGFLFKNKDVLRADMVQVVLKSANPVTASIFEGVKVEEGKLAKGQLIASQFLNQLTSLMALINGTEPHFIRCVKPNETKSPMLFIPSRVLGQLQALSILEALQLRNLGFSYRRPFDEFLLQYQLVNTGIATEPNLTPMERAVKLLKYAKLTQGGYQIGKTMVFMKNTAMKELDVVQRENIASAKNMVQFVEAIAWLWRRRRELERSNHQFSRVQARCKMLVYLSNQQSIAA